MKGTAFVVTAPWGAKSPLEKNGFKVPIECPGDKDECTLKGTILNFKVNFTFKLNGKKGGNVDLKATPVESRTAIMEVPTECDTVNPAKLSN